jgi:hypothetical protein
MPSSPLSAGLVLSALLLPSLASGQACVTQPPLQNYLGGGAAICPCFVAGEQAGAVFTAPAAHYPLEILKVGIAWASQLGTSGQTLEDAIHIYGAGLPNPQAVNLFELPGPLLQDGAINEYNLEPIVGEILVNSGPFTVTLEFLIDNSGQFFAPSLMMDGNGCQAGKNVIKANPGGWIDGCSAGLSGDWVFYVVYRPVCTSGVGDEVIVSSAPSALGVPAPNPFASRTSVEFFLAAPGDVRLDVYDIKGARVAELAAGSYSAGRHSLDWDGRGFDGGQLGSGIYFLKLDAGEIVSTRKVILNR